MRFAVDGPTRTDIKDATVPLPFVRTRKATASLILEVDASASDLVLDWTGPWRSEPEDPLPVDGLDLNITAWSFEPTATGTRHRIRFEWLAHQSTGFRLRSEAACPDGPEFVCTGTSCGLRP